jgi:hypothetical protein
MPFHRLTIPTYYGGLPTGYDYINNADGGTPAPADGKKIGGPNNGTYFVAFQDDATSSNANRANKALAENCDALDDLFRTSQVVIRYIDGVTTEPGTDTFTLPGDVYVGGSNEDPPVVADEYTVQGLVHMVDAYGNDIVVGEDIVSPSDILDASGVSVVGVPASGFYTNPRVYFPLGLPASTHYRIYYLARRSLHDIIRYKPSEFFTNQIRNIHYVPAGLHLQGLNEKYNRQVAYDAILPETWPTNTPVVWSTPGSGAWFKKTAHPITGFIKRPFSGTVQGTLDSLDYLLGATFAAQSNIRLTDFGNPPNSTYRLGAGSGFVYMGHGATAFEDHNATGAPGFFGFGHFVHRRQIVAGGDDSTILLTDSTVSINGDTITLSGQNVFYKNISGSDTTSFAQGIDILVLKDSGGRYYYVTVTKVLSATTGTLRYLDGSHVNISGPTSFTLVAWLSPCFYSADQAVAYYNGRGLGNTLPPAYAGFFFAEPPAVHGSAPLEPRRYVRAFAGDTDFGSIALTWGGFDKTNPTSTGGKYVEKGILYARGGAKFNDVVLFNGEVLHRNRINIEARDDAALLIPKLAFNEPTRDTPVYNLVYESSAYDGSGTLTGKCRVYQHSYGLITTYNARWDTADSKWHADYTVAPASYERLDGAGGRVRKFKRNTAATPSWLDSAWDDVAAGTCTGFKYIAFDYGNTILTIAPDGNWHGIQRTAPSSANLAVMFGTGVEGYVIDVAGQIVIARSPAAPAGTHFDVRLEIDSNNGSGWQPIPGSTLSNDYGLLPTYQSGARLFWSLRGVAVVGAPTPLAGTIRSAVKVRMAVMGDHGGSNDSIIVYTANLRAEMKALGV